MNEPTSAAASNCPILAGVPGVDADGDFDETSDELETPEEEFDIDEAMKIDLDDDEL